jgi:hypothetical protein
VDKQVTSTGALAPGTSVRREHGDLCARTDERRLPCVGVTGPCRPLTPRSLAWGWVGGGVFQAQCRVYGGESLSMPLCAFCRVCGGGFVAKFVVLALVYAVPHRLRRGHEQVTKTVQLSTSKLLSAVKVSLGSVAPVVALTIKPAKVCVAAPHPPPTTRASCGRALVGVPWVSVSPVRCSGVTLVRAGQVELGAHQRAACEPVPTAPCRRVERSGGWR